MYLKVLIFLFTFFHIFDQNECHIPNENTDPNNCQTVCGTLNNLAEYDRENKICKCLLTENIDDIDAEVIAKNTNLRQPNNEKKTKREISFGTGSPSTHSTTPTEPTLLDTTTVISIPTVATTAFDEELNLNPEGIVGQQPPRRLHPQRTVTPRPRHRDTRPISVEQQRLIIQQINDHLNRLTHISEPRLREIEMEAVRTNLRQLTQTHVIQPPQQRSRIRTIEENRRRAQRHRVPHGRVGAAANHGSNENSTSIDDQIPGKKRPFEIITQDPRLIDE